MIERRDAGFTLVEVVVAMAILGLLVALTYAALGSVTRVYDSAEASVARGSRVRVVSEFLHRTLSGARPLAIAKRRGFEVQFEGDAEQLRLIAELPPYVGTGGLHELVLGVKEDDGRQGLWLGRRTLEMDRRSARLTGEFQWRLLAQGVAAVHARYYGSTERDEPATWRDTWPPARSLPRVVELALEDTDGERWPLLRARPRAEVVRYLARRGSGRDGDEESAGGDQGEEDLPMGDASSEQQEDDGR